ncbi:MAG: hypothetical protein GY789_19955 [Hyphomicrobiales bacterium]|nr:hypothetical protein [Hyphomicrobiales bacterium]MCP4999766.1 hypothetical protein [Hyphomicrobiales bacterium]
MRIFVFAILTATGAALASATTSLAQTPTPAQQQAIKSSCVSDYRANCASVPTGGMDALICLEQHEAKLSPACKSAVEAVDHGSGGSSTTATSTAAATTTESSTAKAASEETKTTAAVPKAAAAPASGRPAMSLRQEMRLAARSCARDYRVLCPNLPIGQGNVLFCLKIHANRLSTPCRNALIEAGEKL